MPLCRGSFCICKNTLKTLKIQRRALWWTSNNYAAKFITLSGLVVSHRRIYICGPTPSYYSNAILWCDWSQSHITHTPGRCNRSFVFADSDTVMQLGPSICVLDWRSSLTPLIVVAYSLWSPSIASLFRHQLRFADRIWTVDRPDPMAPVQSCSSLR